MESLLRTSSPVTPSSYPSHVSYSYSHLLPHSTHAPSLWSYIYTSFSTQSLRILRWYNVALLILTLFSWILFIGLFELCFDESTLQLITSTCYYAPTIHILNFLTFIFFLVILILYYHKLVEITLLSQSSYTSKIQIFLSSPMKYYFLCELIIHLCQPYPIYYVLYFHQYLHHFIFVFVFSLLLKIYLFIRLLRDFSMVYQQYSNLLYSSSFSNTLNNNNTLKSSELDLDYTTILKLYFYNYTYQTVFGLFVFIYSILAYLMYIIEREYWIPYTSVQYIPAPYDEAILQLDSGSEHALTANFKRSNLASLYNCFYCIGITMTTTGMICV